MTNSKGEGLGRWLPDKRLPQCAARGIFLAYEKYDKPEPLNLGSGQEISIRDLVTMIVRLIQYDGEIVWDTTKPNGQPRRCISNDRAEKEIGFSPQVDFEKGLAETIAWFKADYELRLRAN